MMAKYCKKPIVVEATQWFKNGDHIEVVPLRTIPGTLKMCKHCGQALHGHGWIDTLEGGHIVCPGDWVITGIKGEYYPCKSTIFEDSYEEVK